MTELRYNLLRSRYESIERSISDVRTSTVNGNGTVYILRLPELAKHPTP